MKISEPRRGVDRVRSIFDKVRGREFNSPEELAKWLQGEKLDFAPRELAAFSHLLVTRLGRHAASNYVPEWLAAVFSSLGEQAFPKSICDPWAGLGFLIGSLQEKLKPETALAFTRNQGEATLGKVLVPRVNWQIGDPIALLAEQKGELDLVASILPMNSSHSRSIVLTLPSGKQTTIDADFGYQLLIATALRLSSSGLGLFVVTPSVFSPQRSVVPRLREFGIGIEATFALPAGTFAPFTSIATYLVVVRPKAVSRMFVAELSTDTNTNALIVRNFREGQEGGSLEMGRLVDPVPFKGLDQIKTANALAQGEKRFGVPPVSLAELAKVKSRIRLGRPGEDFSFEPLENAIYIPLIGTSDVVESPEELTLKAQNYAQVVIDPTKSFARFAARFLNSDFGRQLRDRAKQGFIPKLSLERLGHLRIFIPDLETQRRLVEIEAELAAEQTTVMALQNELTELRREMWAKPAETEDVRRRLRQISQRLSGEIRNHASETLSHWLETLPFPLASILRAWQATPSQDFRAKYEHLLHFFEAVAEFSSVILLSAYSANEAVFAPQKQGLSEAMQKQNLSFSRPTFGTWKLVVEYLGKQTRKLLRESGKRSEDVAKDRSLCGDLFADTTLSLPLALSRKELAGVLLTTNKMRNDWTGHGGVVGQDEADRRNQLLLVEIEKLRDAFADLWTGTQLIHALHCRPRRGQFENEVALLMGSNNEFLKETRSMSTWLDVERLYLSTQEAGRALKLLPLVQVGSSPQSAKNACYFFNRLVSGEARFVSYHFLDKPELIGQFNDVSDAIRSLTELDANS